MRAAALNAEMGVLTLFKMTLGGSSSIVEPADLYRPFKPILASASIQSSAQRARCSVGVVGCLVIATQAGGTDHVPLCSPCKAQVVQGRV